MDHTNLLTPEEAAQFLKVSKTSLESLRRSSTGPKFFRLGHRTVRYSRNDLEAWLASRGVTGTPAA